MKNEWKNPEVKQLSLESTNTLDFPYDGNKATDCYWCPAPKPNVKSCHQHSDLSNPNPKGFNNLEDYQEHLAKYHNANS